MLKGWKIRVKFNPHDLWIGIFWCGVAGHREFYICVLPLLPIKIWKPWPWEE